MPDQCDPQHLPFIMNQSTTSLRLPGMSSELVPREECLPWVSNSQIIFVAEDCCSIFMLYLVGKQCVRKACRIGKN